VGGGTSPRGNDRATVSEVQQRTSVSNISRDGARIAADGARSSAARLNQSNLGGRSTDTVGSKSVDRGTTWRSIAADSIAAPRSGAADSASRRDSPIKFDPGRKPDAIKSSTDRPGISEVRKHIPDTSSAKTRSTEGARKNSGDVTRTPGKANVDASRLPEATKRSGPASSGIDRTKIPGAAKIDSGKAPNVGKQTGEMSSNDFRRTTAKVVTPGVGGLGRSKTTNDAIARAQFADRVKKGDFEALSKSQVGQKVRLADQYRLAQHGDVARRMALHTTNVANVTKGSHATRATSVAGVHGFHAHPNFHYRGWISPVYHRHCFEYRSWFGPTWYPSIWWYPRWSPWLHWSWYYRCNPFWDPRPLWCRPVVYIAVPQPWVAWNCPAWTPLPEVASGTWVEVQKPVVADQQYDLQLLAVRFVDPGHPDEKLGPRYRVWFRNNSNQPITKAFDVRLFASPAEQLAANLPQAAVRVTAIEAGDTQSVDIRLPFEAAQAAGADGKPPFNFIQAIADANREIPDANQANNGARVAAGDVLPVDPAAFEVDPKVVAAGGELVLAGEGLGPEPGKVIVHLGNIEMEAEVLGWYDLGVRVKMPDLPLADATPAELVVIRGDGAATNPVTVTVNPPQR